MRILVFCSSYLPANRGGTVQAVAGVVDHLGGEHDFHIFARDRDDGATEPLEGIERGRWQRLGNATVYYAPPRDVAPNRMAAVVSSIHPDAYYVNSFFSPTFGAAPVLARWLGRLPERPMILAPRGEFHPGALRLKHLKKRTFIEMARRLPAYSDLRWQASGREEGQQIRSLFPRAQIAIARDLTTLRDPPSAPRPPKKPGELSVAYLSRVTPKKNLIGALRMLGSVDGDVRFSIYGPAVEGDYLSRCRHAARTLAPNVKVRFESEVPHQRVLATLASHHVFLLPTFGESFGHAILEALLAGCLLVISDQTPWRDLQSAGVGWDLPLDDEMAFVRALQACVDMGDQELTAASAAARDLGISTARDTAAIEENRALFRLLRVP